MKYKTIQRKETQILIAEIENDIQYSIGKRCKDFNYACWACDVWMAFDILKDFYETK